MTLSDELIVISNQPIETAEPLPKHVRVYEERRFPVRIAWMQFLAARVLEDIRADVAHFTNGMMPLPVGGGDDTRLAAPLLAADPRSAPRPKRPNHRRDG